MIIYDISVPLSSATHVYPGDPGFQMERILNVGEESHFSLSRIAMGTHTGTHLDAPAHFYPDGHSVDEVPLTTLVGPVVVVSAGDARSVGLDLVMALPDGTERVLFKTRNGALWERARFQRRFAHVEPEAAKALVDRGVKLVGIDYLSAEQYGARQPLTHWALLGAGTVILEGLDLRTVPPGEYTLVCLPLKLMGAEGAPVRAVLLAGATANISSVQ